MSTKKFKNYLLNLGYSKKEISNNLKDSVYTHSLNIGGQFINVKYVLAFDQQKIFETHKLLWNKNSDATFIAVGEEKTHIINTKVKPDNNQTLKKRICIESFEYGINSDSYSEIDIEKISKDYICSAYFFDFVRKNQKIKQEVDKDLLLNLLALRNDMLNGNNEQVVHLLILRCLFVKYLEDRGIFENGFLVNILKSNEPESLLIAFDEVCKINGDVFGDKWLTKEDISNKHLICLARFFGCDYRSGQGTLFPYEFNSIPIQLISHVYEAFLKSDTKKGKGVYYTPSFVVDFMLSQTLKKSIQKDKKLTILDPAVGSAAFLVESFKIIQESYGKNIDFEKKKWILENQLFGIDVDENALQIAAFSLYLALLETEEASFIKQQIEIASPILPSLIGKTLKNANAITEDPFEKKQFGLIVSNPPWGSVPKDDLDEHINERSAIDNKDKEHPEYENVADYERSQAFLMRVSRWSNEETVFALIIKNSIFLNDQAKRFRNKLLNEYAIDQFYELSHYNKILFKKKVIGEINGTKIETGASEPCAIMIFKKSTDSSQNLKYISPKLTSFSEHYECIQFADRDVYKIPQNAFIENDLLWRILVNGDIETSDLIVSKIALQKEVEIEARAGFQPKRDMKSLGEPIWKTIIKSGDFESFCITNNNLASFNWNQELHRRRDEKIFKGSRIIIPVRPLKKDNLMFRGIILSDEIVYSDDIISLKFLIENKYIDSLEYLGIINSKLIGFYLYNISTQWGKGESKRATLRNVDIEQLPIKKVDGSIKIELRSIVKEITSLKKEGQDYTEKEAILNELVFDLYGLFEYEKEIIREFYQVNVNRADEKNKAATMIDMQKYFEIFKNTFSQILSPENTLKANYHVSKNVGAIISFSIVKKNEAEEFYDNANLQILNFVKTKQLKEADTFKILNEEKVKLYNQKQFIIIKSNLFKDWTARQAMIDAKEEISLLLSHLPEVHE